MTLGSLFDGSGGFPLAGLKSNIEPIWASEIEPYPILVTRKNLPSMKHYGDVSMVNGAQVEPVDIITFGSPCQDLSIAGKREGLTGERSSLFMQAVRIIKEMRNKTNGKYPRFAVWENVPGAFSSAGGQTSEPYSKNSAKSKNRLYQFLNLKNGCGQVTLWDMDIQWHGEYSTLNSGECPNIVRESFLSQILIPSVPTKYYLSPKACQGILNRVKRKGKALPTELEEALKAQML